MSETALEVANMATELNEMRERLHDLELSNRAYEAENALYSSRCKEAEEAAINELVRSTQMRQILTDMSAMLIAGLKRMEEEVDAARRDRAEKEARRREQERALEVGSGDLPVFMQADAETPVTAPSEPPETEIPEPPARVPINEFAPKRPTPLEQLRELAATGEPDNKGPTFR